MRLNDRIYVSGHRGLVGSALIRRLLATGYTNILTREKSELNLMDGAQVAGFFGSFRPDYVFHAAAKVGGVYANNSYRADFIYENLMIQSNVIHQAFLNETKRLIFFGASSMYPKFAAQPIKEDSLLTGSLEPTNQPFAVAKIAGVEMCEAYNRQYATEFVSLIPTNLYGPGQNYERMNSQVLPALVRKFHEAKLSDEPEVVIWGSGNPSRDFLHSDDLADASIFMMENLETPGIYNVGTGRDYLIKDIVDMIRDVSGYKGRIVYDTTKPEGVLSKLQDLGKIRALGWRHRIELRAGIESVYREFAANYAEIVSKY
jgi:GDP-L-fucose synthase